MIVSKLEPDSASKATMVDPFSLKALQAENRELKYKVFALETRNALIKQLNGLYALGLLEGTVESVDELMTAFVEEAAPTSMQYPDHTIAIVENGKRLWANSTSEPHFELRSPIVVKGKAWGMVRIGYDTDLPFLDVYEQKLVDGYALRLGSVLEREELKKACKINDLVESGNLGVINSEIASGEILFANDRTAEMVGIQSGAEMIGMHITDFIDSGTRNELVRPLQADQYQYTRVRAKRTDGSAIELDISMKMIGDSQVISIISMLDRSQHIVVMCANCNRIRDADNWMSPSEYFEDHFESIRDSQKPLGFSHGICPECGKDLYGDILGAG